MHVSQKFFPGFIDKSDLIQRHPFDRLPGSDAFLPADFQFLDPGSGQSSLQSEYRSPCVSISGNF